MRICSIRCTYLLYWWFDDHCYSLAPPHCSKVSISILKIHLSLCAQIINWCLVPVFFVPCRQRLFSITIFGRHYYHAVPSAWSGHKHTISNSFPLGDSLCEPAELLPFMPDKHPWSTKGCPYGEKPGCFSFNIVAFMQSLANKAANRAITSTWSDPFGTGHPLNFHPR